jgi:cephalosporin hydroxylase
MDDIASLQFCPVLEKMYRTRIAVGRSGHATQHIGGLSTVNNLLAIRHLMQEMRPDRTLEIGLACGGSALLFASMHREHDMPPGKQHTAIDAYQEAFDDVGILNLERADLSGYVHLVRERSSLALPKLMESGATFGIIYIDGSHQYEDVFCDFYYASRLLKHGGYIMFDDSTDKQVRRVIRYIDSDLSHAFERVSMKRYRRRQGLSRMRDHVVELLGKNQLTVFQRISPSR